MLRKTYSLCGTNTHEIEICYAFVYCLIINPSVTFALAVQSRIQSAHEQIEEMKHQQVLHTSKHASYHWQNLSMHTPLFLQEESLVEQQEVGETLINFAFVFTS